jgi:putative DNA primase/helicase
MESSSGQNVGRVARAVEGRQPKPLVLTCEPEGIPEEMREYDSWVCWRYVWRDDRWKKVPYDPATKRSASTTDARTWGPFEAAVEAYGAGDFDGIGFVFGTGDPFSGVDLDDCRDPETGEIEPWAKKIIERSRGYAEASPSKTGVHVIVKAKAPNRRRGSIECYSSERFFAMTGLVP